MLGGVDAANLSNSERATCGGNALYREASPWGFRLPMTNCLRIIFLHQPPDALRPLPGGMIIRYVDATPVLERDIKRQQVGDAIPSVFHVVAFALPRFGRDRVTRFARALHAGLVHTHHRMGRIRRPPVHGQYRFRLVHEAGTRRPHSQARECTTSASARV